TLFLLAAVTEQYEVAMFHSGVFDTTNDFRKVRITDVRNDGNNRF
ncbi:hypothetical protein D049_2706B, partial [Vibrio parahaemolyticus VPTS-2010]